MDGGGVRRGGGDWGPFRTEQSAARKALASAVSTVPAAPTSGGAGSLLGSRRKGAKLGAAGAAFKSLQERIPWHQCRRRPASPGLVPPMLLAMRMSEMPNRSMRMPCQKHWPFWLTMSCLAVYTMTRPQKRSRSGPSAVRRPRSSGVSPSKQMRSNSASGVKR